MDRTQTIQRSEQTANILNEWRRHINAQTQTRRPLWRRVARALVPVLGPLLVLAAPPLGIIALALAHR